MKRLFMLIVLACAVYWGFSQGSGIEKYIPASLTGSAPKAASSAPSSAKKDDSLYGEVTDMVSTFASGVTGTTDSGKVTVNKSKDAPNATVAKEQDIQTLRQNTTTSRISRKRSNPASTARTSFHSRTSRSTSSTVSLRPKTAASMTMAPWIRSASPARW